MPELRLAGELRQLADGARGRALRHVRHRDLEAARAVLRTRRVVRTPGQLRRSPHVQQHGTDQQQGSREQVLVRTGAATGSECLLEYEVRHEPQAAWLGPDAT